MVKGEFDGVEHAAVDAPNRTVKAVAIPTKTTSNEKSR
jgi:hypothetical protein